MAEGQAGVDLVSLDLIPGLRTYAWTRAVGRAGGHKDVAASAVVRAASADGYQSLVAASCGNYGLALRHAARAGGVNATIVVPDDGVATQILFGDDVVAVDGSYEHAVAASRRLAVERGAADGNVDGPYRTHVLEALGSIATDVLRASSPPPDYVWVPVGNGTTLAAIGQGLRRDHPAIAVMGVSAVGNNSVLSTGRTLRRGRHVAIVTGGQDHTCSVSRPSRMGDLIP